MSDWTGLDSGGTEQLFEPSVLLDALEIFKRHEPFSRNNPDSPIFADLEELYPDITWKNYDAHGSFRPIFRKTNPWVKLGLTTTDTVNALVTPVGDELLSGEKSIYEVFIEATKNHHELNGAASFSTMCRAAISLPTEVFTLEDVEFAVSKTFEDGTEPLVDALNRVRSSNITFTSGSRRKRTLHSFMNALVTAGALSYTNNGWILNDGSVASEIAKPSSTSPYTTITQPISRGETAPHSPSLSFKSIAVGDRTPPTYINSESASYDPIKRALLLEKANLIHEKLVEKCAIIIRELGKEPIEDPNSFDVAIQDLEVIVEIKSINRANAISQFRKAIAQLPEYRWRYKSIFSQNTHLIIVTNENPEIYIPKDFMEYVKQDRNLHLFWQDGEKLTNSDGLSFQEFLTQIQ